MLTVAELRRLRRDGPCARASRGGVGARDRDRARVADVVTYDNGGVMATLTAVKQAEYTKAQAKRDLNPHKPARVAMALWGPAYARGGLGSMGFWDSLSPNERNIARYVARMIENARYERADEHPDEPRYADTPEASNAR